MALQGVPLLGQKAGLFYFHLSQSLDISRPRKGLSPGEAALCSRGSPYRGWLPTALPAADATYPSFKRDGGAHQRHRYEAGSNWLCAFGQLTFSLWVSTLSPTKGWVGFPSALKFWIFQIKINFSEPDFYLVFSKWRDGENDFHHLSYRYTGNEKVYTYIHIGATSSYSFCHKRDLARKYKQEKKWNWLDKSSILGSTEELPGWPYNVPLEYRTQNAGCFLSLRCSRLST